MDSRDKDMKVERGLLWKGGRRPREAKSDKSMLCAGLKM
jgi:hypothetical protein